MGEKKRGTLVMALLTTIVVLVSVNVGLTQEKPFKGITLRWLTSPQAETDAVKALLAEFEKETGMKIIMDIMDEERVHTKVTTEAAAGVYSYDVIGARDVDIATYIDVGVIQPIEELIESPQLPVPGCDIDDYPKGAFDSMCRWFGKLWGLPFTMAVSGLAYRKDWFEGAGIAPPATWDELLDAAKYFTKNGRYGITFRAQRGHHAAYAWYTTTLMPFGGRQFDYDTMVPLYNNARNLESLEAFLRLCKYAPPGIITHTHEEAISIYSMGKSAMISEHGSLFPWIERADSKAAGKTGYTNVPKKYARVERWTGIGGWIWSICAYTEHPIAAMAMIEYFTSKRNAIKMIENGGLAQRVSTLTNPVIRGMFPWNEQQLEGLKVAKYLHPKLVGAPGVNEITGTHVNAVLVEEETPKDALDKMETEVYNLMKEKRIYTPVE